MKKEIGGYLELETYGTSLYHKDAVLLNSGRNSLRYIIRAYDIHVLFVPYYTCHTVWDAVREENCEIVFYDIGKNLLPQQNFSENTYILVNNYFGVCDENVIKLSKQYRNLIVDNAQSFYSKPYGIATFYSPRKFFGLPDGGILYCNNHIDERFEKDVSFERMSHLLKRHDLGANGGFSDFKRNEKSLSCEPIKEISALTIALMGNIDYEKILQRRLDNYRMLYDLLGGLNELYLPDNPISPMVYPLLIKSNTLRQMLIDENIYIANYWSTTKNTAPRDSYSNYLCDYLLPLPIDQRWTAEDMKRIANIIL